MTGSVRQAMAPVVDFIYPPRCPACGHAVGRQGGLCADCWEGLVIPAEPWCAACQRPFGIDGPGGEALCAPCLQRRPDHDGIYAATLYTPVSRKLLLTFKHGRRIAMAPMLARLMAARLPDDGIDRLIVPVPLHRWRLWRRGFNQAALLAKELERHGKGKVLIDALVRRKQTPSLGGLGARARRRALSGAIAVRQSRSATLVGRHILLVDDVLTSGATSSACVRALIRSGAASVRVACFARVLDEAIGTSSAKLANETPGTHRIPGAA